MISLGFSAIYVVVTKTRTWKVMSEWWLGWVGVWALSESCPEVIQLSGRRNWTLFDLNQAPFINIHTRALTFSGLCKLLTLDWRGKTSLAQTLLCFYQRSRLYPLICLCQKKDKPHISQTNLIPSSIYVSKRFP